VIAFFDAGVLINLTVGKERFAARVRRQLAAATGAHPDIGAAPSRLTGLECRVGPIFSGDAAFAMVSGRQWILLA
jgi:hypothetical protein